MVYEFQRYGIPQYRHLTGILQLSAALGLLAGHIQPWMAQVAAGGLALQMACGLIVRFRIGDCWYQCVPAGAYLLLCTYLVLSLA